MRREREHAAEVSWDDGARPGEADAVALPEGCRAFDAELDASELDERDRPTATWAARARGLSESRIVFRSRRMCYSDRLIILAIHLVDATPVPLFGRVSACEYEGEGMYVVEIELLERPRTQALAEWIGARSGSRRSA